MKATNSTVLFRGRNNQENIFNKGHGTLHGTR